MKNVILIINCMLIVLLNYMVIQGWLGPKINRYSEIRKESPPKRGVRSMFPQENFSFKTFSNVADSSL